jgi:hypothetical protein
MSGLTPVPKFIFYWRVQGKKLVRKLKTKILSRQLRITIETERNVDEDIVLNWNKPLNHTLRHDQEGCSQLRITSS